MAVGCHVPRHPGKSTHLHTALRPPPPLSHPRSPGGHSRAASGYCWPGVWYSWCPNPVLLMQDLILQSFFEKTSESNLDDAGQPVWDLGFVSFCGCLLITPGRPETLLVRILCPEPLRTGRGPRAEATRTTGVGVHVSLSGGHTPVSSPTNPPSFSKVSALCKS